MNPLPDYYVTGGTLSATADCYVTRQADTDLTEALLRGELCYVLSSRQMGKSSLMVRAAAAIRESGGHAVLFDLTAIGHNVTPEQWYLGMLCQFGDMTDSLHEIVAYWHELRDIGPLQRFVSSIRRITSLWPSGSIVILIDEIDVVTLLPFSTDEFFAAIRECHNRKAIDPVLGRLTFCLLGVAVPSDLIQDPASTPFNIGRRIVLTDFTAAEAEKLERGLDRHRASVAQRLMRRVLFWTGGHPYMTQRLCAALQQDASAHTPRDVDRLCRTLFMQPAARDSDPNLAFAQRFLLAYSHEHTAILPLYHRLLLGERIVLDEADPVHNKLLLSGAVGLESNCMRVRNRIFAQVFDRAWVRTQLPRSEIQIQRFVYLRGLRRGLWLSAYLILIFVVAGSAIFNRRQAILSSIQSERDADRAYRVAYDYRFVSILERMRHFGLAPGLQTLARTMPPPGKADIRGFEWYYLNKICNQGQLVPGAMPGGITSISWSPHGRFVAYCSGNTTRLWNAAAPKEEGEPIRTGSVEVVSTVISPDSQRLGLACSDGSIRLLRVQDRVPVVTPGGFRGHTAGVNSVAFSHKGRFLASGSADGTVRLWDAATGRPLGRFPATGRLPLRGVWKVAFSPEDAVLASAGDDGTVRLWSVASGAQIALLKGHTSYVHSLAFSPDGKRLATVGGDHALYVWDVSSGHQVQRMFGHTAYLYDVAFSPDGRSLASCGWDKSVRLWDVETGMQTRFIPTKTNGWSLAFSADGKSLAVGTSDGQMRVYEVAKDPVERTMQGKTTGLTSLSISKDNRLILACGYAGDVCVWNASTGAKLYRCGKESGYGVCAASADGRFLARCGASEWILQDADTGRVRQRTRIASGNAIVSAALSEDGAILCTLGTECILWDTRTGTVRDRFTLSTECNSVVLSPNGNRAAFLDRATTPFLIDLKQGHRPIPLTGLDASLHGDEFKLVFGPDNHTLMGIGQTVALWDADSGRIKSHLRDLDGLYIPAAITHDNARLIYGTQYGLFRLWDLKTNQAVMDLPDANPGVSCLGASADGRLLAYRQGNGEVKLLDTRD